MQIATIQPRGFNKDIAAAETGPDVYNDADNVVFSDGFASNAPGWVSTSGVLIGQPLWLLPVYTPLVYWWIYGGNNDAGTAGFLAVTDGTNHFDITPVGGLQTTAPGDWTGGVLNGVPVINNSVDDPMWWDLQTGNPAQILPDWPASTKCKALRPFKFHLFAMNVTQAGTEFPDLILHSDAADPGTIPGSWTPAPDNQAGSFSIATVTGGIIDGAELRDLFIVYKQASCAVVQFTGGAFVFSTRKLFVSTGMLSTDCAQEYQGAHYCITDGDIVRHNGQQVESLVDGSLRNWLFSQTSNEVGAAHVAIDHSTKQVWFNFPTSGDIYCDLSLVWDLNSQSMGVVYYDPFVHMARGILGDQNIDRSWDVQAGDWDSFPGAWDQTQFNPANDTIGFVRYVEKEFNVLAGSQRGGSDSECRLQLLSKDFGQPTRYKTIDRIFVNTETGTFSASDMITGRIGSQESPNEPIRWSPVLPLYRDKSMAYGISGRYISIELNIRQQDVWRVNSMDVHYLVGGV